MLQTPSRASTASSSSFQPISRQNTMSSYEGSRSARQSKRYSMSALYMSMSANETELEIEDDLAKGELGLKSQPCHTSMILTCWDSAKGFARTQGQNLVTVQEELRARERCPLPRLADRLAHSKPHGIGRSTPESPAET